MAEDLATLGLAVDSRPIAKAGDELDRFEKQARKTDTATATLEKRLEKLVHQYDANYRAGKALALAEKELNAAQAAGLITTKRRAELLKLVTAQEYGAAAATSAHTRALGVLNTTAGAFARRFGAPLAAGLGAIIGGKAFIDASVEAQAVLAQVEAVIRSTGGAAGLSSGEILGMAGALQRVTTFGDETIAAAEGVLLTFTKIGAQVFPDAIATVLDMSTALGTDAKEGAIQLGKALQDPIQGINALRRVGVSFTAEQRETIKTLVETGRRADAQRMILKELQVEFGGSAVAARQTLGGALKSLQNSFGDLFEVSNEGSSNLVASINNVTDKLSDPQTIASVQNFGAALFNAFSGTIDLLRRNSDLLPTLAAAMLGGKLGGPIGALFGALSTDFLANTVKGTAANDQPFATDEAAIAAGRAKGFAENSFGPAFASSPTGNVTNSAMQAAFVRRQRATAELTEEQLQEQQRLQKQFDSALLATTKQTQAIEAQAATFNMTAGAAAEYAKKQELINLAEQNHIALTPQVLKSIDEKAAALGRATDNLQRMNDQQEAQTFLAQSFFDAARGAASLSDAVSNLAGKIAEAAFEAALLGSGPLAGVLGTKSDSGGLLGSIIGGLLGFAGGGEVSGRGSGTSDSIVARVSNGEFVVNAAATSRYRPLLEAVNDNRRVPGFAAGGSVDVGPQLGGDTVQVTYAPVYNVTGSGPEIDALRAEMAADRESFAARFVDTYHKAKSRKQVG